MLACGMPREDTNVRSRRNHPPAIRATGDSMKTIRLFALSSAILMGATAALAQASESKHVEVYGQKIAYVDEGTGPAVILLHGLGANHGIWRATIPALAATYHVYALDQLGSGASDKPLIDYRVGVLSDFLEEFMNRLAIPRASLVGNSLGGWVAAEFAIQHPERVEKVILLDNAGYFVDRPTRASLAFLNPSTLSGVRAMLEKTVADKQRLSDALVRRFYTDKMKSGDSYTIDRFIDSMARGEDVLTDRLGSIAEPTLVIWGRDDPLIPLSVGETIASKIPNARKVILDHCGHIPPLECSSNLNVELTKFLAAAPAASNK
jgi:2-hydroxy-6-oxonona-2,4-dienedioate hydrolase